MFIRLHSKDVPVLLNINQIQFITGDEDMCYVGLIGDTVEIDENLCEVYDKLNFFNLIYGTRKLK